jgi:integrase
MHLEEEVKSKKFRFTKLALKSLQQTSKVERYYDTDLPGLALTVYPTGKKSFTYQRKIEGKVKRKVLGSYPELAIDNARELALKTSNTIKEVLRNEKENPTFNYSEMTFEELYALYLDNFRISVTQGFKRIKSMNDIESTWRTHLKKTALSKTKIRDVTFDQGRRLLNSIKIKSPSVYNKTLTLCKAMYNMAKQEQFTNVNPFETFKKVPSIRRNRYLQSHEMKAFFDSLNKQAQIYQDAVYCLLYTGQRKHCVFSMEWSELDLTRGLWFIPATKFKTHKAHTIPLPSDVHDILRRRFSERESRRFVFPAPGHSKLGHLSEKSGKSSFWRIVTERAGLYSEDKNQRLTMHDLRRTFASWQAMQNESILNISKVLGHSDTRITSQVYAHLQADQMKAGMESTVNAIRNAGRFSEVDN